MPALADGSYSIQMKEISTLLSLQTIKLKNTRGLVRKKNET